jgi:hypothetical protein
MDDRDFQACRSVRFVAFLLATLVASHFWPDESATASRSVQTAMSAPSSTPR